MSDSGSGFSRYGIGGYVLAGGRSTRMGRDKALLEVAGKTLVERAVEKLWRVCAEVSIAGPEALAEFAPVVRDLHPGCGPLSGIEAALAHSRHEWNLFLAVDMPLIPTAILEAEFVRVALSARPEAVAVMQTVDGRDQPLCAMYHRSLLPHLSRSLEAGEYRMMGALREAVRMLAEERNQAAELLLNAARVCGPEDASDDLDLDGVPPLTAGQRAARAFWFANVNTPEDLALIEGHADGLEG